MSNSFFAPCFPFKNSDLDILISLCVWYTSFVFDRSRIFSRFILETLSFFNVEGSYQLENGLIHISTQSYPTNYSWRIVSLTEQELVVKIELSEQEIEHRSLMDLFTEIETLSYSVSCANATDWNFVAYGSKACGGSQGYIPYSKNIDTVLFLEKIAQYTNAENEYNIKWGIASDCSITNPPTSVECQNGYPTLIY